MLDLEPTSFPDTSPFLDDPDNFPAAEKVTGDASANEQSSTEAPPFAAPEPGVEPDEDASTSSLLWLVGGAGVVLVIALAVVVATQRRTRTRVTATGHRDTDHGGNHG
ncbi:hypothetical protein [Cellulomonas triticagri]|nr:hypothetical protein [Cellulomonas triticagri]